jgi:thermostable 8-oxoguanine DNA glycosylase
MSKHNPSDFSSVAATKSKQSAQWWFIFSVIVAGKNAEFATKATNALLGTSALSPFDSIASAIESACLSGALRIARTGNYGKLVKAFVYITDAIRTGVWSDDPRTWGLDDLMSIPGVGPKTARWFLLLVEPTAEVAALDTHVLKFLRDCDLGGLVVPKSTPAWGPTYRDLEGAFVYRAKKLGMSCRDLDFFVWATYRNGGKVVGL